jgi:hypothetical protein
MSDYWLPAKSESSDASPGQGEMKRLEKLGLAEGAISCTKRGDDGEMILSRWGD